MERQTWITWLVAMAGEVGGEATVTDSHISVVIDSKNFLFLPTAGLYAIFEATDFVQQYMLKAPQPHWWGIYIDYPIPFVV